MHKCISHVDNLLLLSFIILDNNDESGMKLTYTQWTVYTQTLNIQKCRF